MSVTSICSHAALNYFTEAIPSMIISILRHERKIFVPGGLSGCKVGVVDVGGGGGGGEVGGTALAALTTPLALGNTDGEGEET